VELQSEHETNAEVRCSRLAMRNFLVQAEVHFEGHDNGNRLAVRAHGWLAAPGLQRLDGIVVEAEAGALQHAQVGQPAVELHNRFD
jgi:hypothetical protein